MAADGIEAYPSREDRIVAEFGDGFGVEGIALRYGLTVAQVYAVVEREVGPADQGSPSHYSPPGYYAPPPPAASYYAPPPAGPQGYYAPPAYAAPEQGLQPPQGFLDGDAIVAEYGEGNDVEWIARKHGITVERVREVVQRIVADDPRPPSGPTSSW